MLKKADHSFFLPTNSRCQPLIIAELYRYRWRVEIFFKWIKQHLRIKNFFGTFRNAVKTQIWIAISTYVLVAIMKKRLKIDLTLYTILQILSITLFEKMPILQALTANDYKNKITSGHIQLKLFEFLTGHYNKEEIFQIIKNELHEELLNSTRSEVIAKGRVSQLLSGHKLLHITMFELI